MNNNNNNKSFGDYLKRIRIKRRESLADVSGAVEIDVMVLDRIEAGNIKPSEDILMLLISYYCLKEDEALRLWQLGGYDNSKKIISDINDLNSVQNTSSVDTPILYTDSVQISANQYGLIINFLQGMGTDGKPLSVARLGMSREHAHKVVDILKKSIELTDSK